MSLLRYLPALALYGAALALPGFGVRAVLSGDWPPSMLVPTASAFVLLIVGGWMAARLAEHPAA